MRGGGDGGGASGAGTTAPAPVAAPVAAAGAGEVGPLGPVHRLRTIRARELALAGGALLGEGSFGKVQVGVWNGTDVAIKANGVDCRDPTAIDREREMWVPTLVCKCACLYLCACVCVCSCVVWCVVWLGEAWWWFGVACVGACVFVWVLYCIMRQSVTEWVLSVPVLATGAVKLLCFA